MERPLPTFVEVFPGLCTLSVFPRALYSLGLPSTSLLTQSLRDFLLAARIVEVAPGLGGFSFGSVGLPRPLYSPSLTSSSAMTLPPPDLSTRWVSHRPLCNDSSSLTSLLTEKKSAREMLMSSERAMKWARCFRFGTLKPLKPMRPLTIRLLGFLMVLSYEHMSEWNATNKCIWASSSYIKTKKHK